jgi:hypothetical protein
LITAQEVSGLNPDKVTKQKEHQFIDALFVFEMLKANVSIKFYEKLFKLLIS